MVSQKFFLSVLSSAVFPVVEGFVGFVRTENVHQHSSARATKLNSAIASELPDSLQDAAEIAAKATTDFVMQAGSPARCRVDFDTSVGDETYPLLKSSAEFMQNFVSACCYAMIDGLQEQRQAEMTRVAQAKAELRLLAQQKTDEEMENDPQVQALVQIVQRRGSRNEGDDLGKKKKVPKCRVYFPDEGNAALARRDWLNPIDNPKVPRECVEFSSCGGVQLADITDDHLVFFFCPKAAESDNVIQILRRHEETSSQLKMTCFVNPNLVDMGVTGYGMAGRLLRERLIDPLQYTYYLRTLPWGALTRIWPKPFTVWQEDETALSTGGYKLIQTLDRLPSNPEVEDIYDIANGNLSERKSGGVLDQLGDFMQGMMRL